jgi:hypothetical protein
VTCGYQISFTNKTFLTCGYQNTFYQKKTFIIHSPSPLKLKSQAISSGSLTTIEAAPDFVMMARRSKSFSSNDLPENFRG